MSAIARGSACRFAREHQLCHSDSGYKLGRLPPSSSRILSSPSYDSHTHRVGGLSIRFASSKRPCSISVVNSSMVRVGHVNHHQAASEMSVTAEVTMNDPMSHRGSFMLVAAR